MEVLMVKTLMFMVMLKEIQKQQLQEQTVMEIQIQKQLKLPLKELLPEIKMESLQAVMLNKLKQIQKNIKMEMLIKLKLL